MTERSFLTIHVSENGLIDSVQADFALETSQDLLKKALVMVGSSITEFKTIILMKLVRQTDNHFTWFVKYPPETLGCFCTRCRCRSAHALDDESLWISPEATPQPANSYLSIQMNTAGEVESASARNVVLKEYRSLIEEPLNLNGFSIGEFQTITLLKVSRPDNYYTWIIKHPVESTDLNSVTQDALVCHYTGLGKLDDKSLWLKPKA